MSSIAWACCWNAALGTRTSSPPSAEIVWSTAWRAKAGSATSPDRRRARPLLADRVARELCAIVLVEIGDGDVGALAREQHRHGAADAGVGPGDQRHPVLQLARALVVRRVPHGLELQVGLAPGLVQVLGRQRRNR